MKKTPLKRYTPLKAKTTLKAKTQLKRTTPLRTNNLLTYKVKSTSKSGKTTHRDLKKYGFSVLTCDLYTCYISGRTDNIHIHHIFGSANKANSEKYGFIVPLTAEWHNMSDHGVHFNKDLDLKLKRACEEYWLSHYGSSEDFIIIFGKWW